MSSTEIVKPTLANKVVKLVTTKASPTAADILKVITDDVIERKAEAPVLRGGETKVPQTYVGLSADDQDVLAAVLTELDEVRLPSKARELTEDEVRRYVPLYRRITGLVKSLGDAEANFKVMWNNHFNRQVEADGKVDASTPVDTHGNWWVKADTSEFTDLDDKVSRTVVNGSPDFDVEVITAMYQAGEISSTLYGRLTKQVRVVNHVGVAAEVARNPELAEKLEKAVFNTKAPSVRINIARNGA